MDTTRRPGDAARVIAQIAQELGACMDDGNWIYARDKAKTILSIASKCLQRAKVVLELQADGYAAAEVDRALVRQNGQLPQ